MSKCQTQIEQTQAAVLAYAQRRIVELGLGDSPTNCHGVVAEIYPETLHVRLTDGVGLDVLCQTEEHVEAELIAMARWYAESR